MGHALFNMLPNICGVLLAAVGVALPFTPEISRIPVRIRFALAFGLLVIGLTGLYSSVQQSQDDERARQELATTLRDQLRPRMEVEEPRAVTRGPGLVFNSEISNVGGSMAKGVTEITDVTVGPLDKSFQDALFQHLYGLSLGGNLQPRDIAPGLEGKFNLPIYGAPLVSEQEFDTMPADRVLYMVVLVSFRDETGNLYHTEKCMFLRPGGIDQFCKTHNAYL